MAPSQLCFFLRQLVQARFLGLAEDIGDTDAEGGRKGEFNDKKRSAKGVNEQRMLRNKHWSHTAKEGDAVSKNVSVMLQVR